MYGQLEPCQEILGGKAALGGKPSQEEEGPTESFKELIVDKVNKENFNRSIDLFPCKSYQCILLSHGDQKRRNRAKIR